MWLARSLNKRKTRVVGFLLLAIILGPTIFYIIAVTRDWYVPYVNPPPSPTVINFPILIPPEITNATGPGWPGLYVGIGLRANGPIVEGTKVTLVAGPAWIASHDYYLRFFGIQIFFQGSVLWSFKNSSSQVTQGGDVGWPSGLIYQRNVTNFSNVNLYSVLNNTQIYFPTSGD